MKKITILGSTGSIGTQALDIIEKNPDRFQVEILTCGRNIELLKVQARQFQPRALCVESPEDALALQKEFPGMEVLWGTEGLKTLAKEGDSDLVLNSLVGIAGLEPTCAAIDAGKDIALANKETLVAGGKLVMDKVKAAGVRLLPVDSEHSAIFQCLEGNENREVENIYLTASGGPFRGYSLEQLEQVTVEQALRHPNWSMGAKVTIDSASMMNKGLEVMEACWLFNLPPEKVRVLVHPQSIVHSMVQFKDHSVLAQLGLPDMRIPISLALGWPDRIPNSDEGIDFISLGSLTFEGVDRKVFKCLDLAYKAMEAGDSYPVVLNGANEALVAKFLKKEIGFTDIGHIIEREMEQHIPVRDPGLQDILEIDKEVKGKINAC
ncbi:MAG: 1-deoxy-D-xylulose-5-phosphate reductoisomerase [Clostridiales bacterium]|nr:1-deoxy-D-xylulose-5-phosphate reductoisomerase [Clostridiales bacterium]